VRNKWLTGRAIKLHVTAFLVMGLCLAAGWWQLQRALGGHGPSWAYTIEWPFFAGYAAFTWWKLLHEEPEFAKEKATMEALSTNGSAVTPTNGVTAPTNGVTAPKNGTATESNGAAAPASPREEREDREREAYNEYLRALSAEEGRKRT
jgi:hypothetical protein